MQTLNPQMRLLRIQRSRCHRAAPAASDGKGRRTALPGTCLGPVPRLIEKERAAPCARETAFLLSRRPAMPLTPLELSCAALAVFCAGLIRGATGFGFSMICIVLLTLLLPPAHHRAGDRALGDRGQCWAFALCLQGSGLESPAPSGAGRGLGHAAGRVLFGLGARRADDRGHQYGRVGPDGHAFFRLQAAGSGRAAGEPAGWARSPG